MSSTEIDQVMRFVDDVAKCRHPWLSKLRAPTQREYDATADIVSRLPVVDGEVDRTPTVVLGRPKQ
jgi:hypothetical protein